MTSPKSCVVLLILALGWYGLPEQGFAWDYTQSTNFGALQAGDLVHFKVTPPKNSEGKDAIVTKGRCDQPGGFIWVGSLANWNGTVPPDFSAQHIGLFSGEYGYPGTNAGRALTWKMDTAALVIKVKFTTTKGHGLWWFAGENAANYDESGTLTAQGATTGIFKWDVIAGNGRVDLNNGGADADSITATDDNTVTIKSTDDSGASDDVTIKLTYNGTEVCEYKLTVYAPAAAAVVSGPTDSSWGNGYRSVYTMEVRDQFGTVLPVEVEVNEDFGAWVSDYAGENWPPVPPNGVMTIGIQLTDMYGIAGTYTPMPVNPGAVGANTKVDHAEQYYRAGSTIPGNGRLIKTHTFQSYRGKGRQE
ncbi:MAG: hypothetical protein ABIK26_00270 [Candidatus Omnitrophota bacterium]